MRPSPPLRPRLGDTRPALPWVLALSSLLAGCYSTRRQHVIGDYELPPLEEGDALRVQVSTGSASEYQGRIPVWYLQEAGIAPSALHEAPPSRDLQRYREILAAAMVGPGEALAHEAPAGWQFQPAIPGANRADVTCDYRLELTNTELRAAPSMALLWVTIPISIFTLTVLPSPMTYRSPSKTPPTMEVRRCADEAVLFKGEYSIHQLATMWMFGANRQDWIRLEEDPFETILADHAAILKDQRSSPPPSAPTSLSKPAGPPTGDRQNEVVELALAWAWNEKILQNELKQTRDYTAYLKAMKDLSSMTAPTDQAFAAVRAGWLPGMSTEAPPSGSGAAGATNGTYASPYLADGSLSDWARRLAAGEAVSQLAGQLSGMATSKAIDQAASHIPYVGGLVASAAKQKVKTQTEQSVMEAFKLTVPADTRYPTGCALISDLERLHSKRADYPAAKAAVLTLYPEVGPQWSMCAKAAPSATAAPAAAPNLSAELQLLTTLHASGALTDAEFEAAKKRVLSQ